MIVKQEPKSALHGKPMKLMHVEVCACVFCKPKSALHCKRMNLMHVGVCVYSVYILVCWYVGVCVCVCTCIFCK
jgi:hypothetical protein